MDYPAKKNKKGMKSLSSRERAALEDKVYRAAMKLPKQKRNKLFAGYAKKYGVTLPNQRQDKK